MPTPVQPPAPIQPNIININVTIDLDNPPKKQWTFKSTDIEIDLHTGGMNLNKNGQTNIVYNLMNADFQIIYANLNAKLCATRQIQSIAIDAPANALTIVDNNTVGKTDFRPFGVYLIARPNGNLGDPITSPDPEVVDDPISK